MLATAWDRFRAGARADLRPAYEQFCDEQAHWLDDYALFRALKARHQGAYYLEWPAELVRRTARAMADSTFHAVQNSKCRNCRRTGYVISRPNRESR